MDTGVQKTNSTENIAVWAITPNGRLLGEMLCQKLKTTHLFLPAKNQTGENMSRKDLVRVSTCPSVTYFDSLKSEINNRFSSFTGHIFIFSTGIVVRLISKLLVSKMNDPAVVVMDDQGDHAISLLSGHIGGANALAQRVADICGGNAVITTATDKNRLPSIDMIAKASGLFIETPENIKRINMAFLKGIKINVSDELNIISPRLPERLIEPGIDSKIDLENGIALTGPDLICSYQATKVSRETLVLRPRRLSVGIGCNRNTTDEQIMAFLVETFEKEGLSRNSIFTIATTDVKKDEIGLSILAEKMGMTIVYYNREQLNSVTTIQNPSEMVEKHLGVKSVCEAAAILAAGGGKLIVPKKKNKDVTIAVAVKK